MRKQTLFAIAALAGGAIFGQDPQERERLLKLDAEKLDAQKFAAEGISVEAKMALAGQVVKNQPYAADAITETTQTLADGSHIQQKTTYSLYRDSEGRQRRENPNQVMISDPVAGVSYVLNTKAQTARKVGLAIAGPVPDGGMAFAGGRGGAPNVVVDSRRESPERRQTKSEDLGTQMIEGVAAQGTRNTTTIPEGSIGNDRPLQIVNERWYSSELQIVVMTRRSDPRNGETVYRLTNIRRNSPDPSLFQIPAGYQTIQAKD
jgi:hypothetical protein